MVGDELEAHEDKCSEKMTPCKKCKCLYKVNQVSEEKPHDCIESMKAQIVNIDAGNYAIK